MQKNVYFETLGTASLNQLVQNGNYSKIIVLVDENTHEKCLDKFMERTPFTIDGIITIKPGEEHKNITTCNMVWQSLADFGCDRKSLLINLGGGVVTDLGGFTASTFKRGMDFVNVPTTLLSMVDAAIGGKTGIDFGVLKNQIGTITQPKLVLILQTFLETLEKRQFVSGYAEMLKHGLIAKHAHWETLKQKQLEIDADDIEASSQVKVGIVEQDPYEMGVRKKLNFGHTLGHAIESYYLEHLTKPTLLHGEAIAAGMILEGYLSHKVSGLSKVSLDEINKVVSAHFDKIDFEKDEIPIFIDLMKHDKKNTHGNINFVLLREIGNAVIDCKVSEKEIQEAFSYYMDR
ncbi:3-dehydroquinate synthase [Croceivirga thetidis]|uniref:3-dehydroquinate synthase n=1 Tax=Croceivirga thetidis TaxID=2721623 RepID=A0ABX1GQL5_9FLAO|nr:3-dehydroquinate synthase [Croceivirga thetidis]NKI32218.1 3-dehydroquinate synthase [Croceivirga thetidis]